MSQYGTKHGTYEEGEFMEEYDFNEVMEDYTSYEAMMADECNERKPFDKQLRKAHYHLNEHEWGVIKYKSKITRLNAKMNKEKGVASPTLEDDELIFGIKFALVNLAPVTKAFDAVATHFGHDIEWRKKVLRYKPRRAQVSHALNELIGENLLYIKIMVDYEEIDLNELCKSTDICNLINKLKKMLKSAQEDIKRKEEITNLRNKIAEQEKAIKELKDVRKNTLLLPQGESIQALRNEFPEISVDGIAQSKCISRSSVYRHLAMGKA